MLSEKENPDRPTPCHMLSTEHQKVTTTPDNMRNFDTSTQKKEEELTIV
jgi:hypothetical protein